MEKNFHRNIIFTKAHLKTNFRFKDVFQIYPCDFADAPKSEYALDNPVVIEYFTDSTKNPEVYSWIKQKNLISGLANQTSQLNKITRLLSAITKHRFFSYSTSDSKWGIIPKENNDESEFNASKIFFPFFYYPNSKNDLRGNEFAAQRHLNSNFISHQNYYLQGSIDNLVDDNTQEISFSDLTEKILENYFNLDEESQKIVDAVAHLICNGIDIKQSMKSLSFISFVSSIETLANYYFRNHKVELHCESCKTIKESSFTCNECGRPIWGVTAKFKTFLSTYISNEESTKSKYNKIYNMRSRIVHNGTLLLGDEQLNWKESKKEDSEWRIHFETMQMARAALANWLIWGPDLKPRD